jgi:polar amino acid transport system substrate-binding protein
MIDTPDTPTARAALDLAPLGSVRVAINLGNPILAQRDPVTCALGGVSVELARALGQRLGKDVTLVPFDSAGQVVAAIGAGAWDVAFLAIDPLRATEISFTAPYVIIEGGYLVCEDSALRTVSDVDRHGIKIAAGKNAAYDLYLTRTLKQATLVHAPTSSGGIDLFLEGMADVAAGIRKPLLAVAKQRKGLQVLDGRFMLIEQAMGIPTGREAGARYLHRFVEEMKASGFVAEALARSGQADARVAPPDDTPLQANR